MEGILQASSCFSLNHIFFDGVLDRLSEHSFKCSDASNKPSHRSPECTVYYGKIYRQFMPHTKVVDAMLVRNGKIELLGSADEVNAYVLRLQLKVRYQYLSERHAICPGFIEPNIHLVMSAVLQQWYHLGPFGLDCSWQKLMVHYSYSYIARALLYLDKGLESQSWLLGYGLHSGLLGHNVNISRQEVFKLINQLDIKRPIAILDAGSAIAYVNDSALEQIYNYLKSNDANSFSSKTAFFDLIHQQKGLYNEQLVWLAGSLPEAHMQMQLDNIYTNIEKVIATALRQGVTHLGVIDTHPFARKILAQYQPTIQHINLVEPKHSWLQELNSLACLGEHIKGASKELSRSIVIDIGQVGYCGYEWVQSYHGQSLLQPCQQLVDQGYNVCLQSGFPAQPLNLMRAAEQASTRIMEYAPGCYTRHERVLLPEQCLSKEQSLHAVTNASAIHLGCNAGKLQEGQSANFVHLSDDPLGTGDCWRDFAVIDCYANK
ncbi:hypothetical protein PSECIP111951_01627 [Pseudoalteromonas holothuriae]|uniref:Amidohydrolase 3 domain-containing protein n=1 Tax=Pseudoalteromonas holothuriae TaxID=2963714 RepID=A0A9W4VMI7_9GAMM|nr:MULTISPECIES: amidohydrolase family protein [unclassified Pseudoalteromonas]CAH9051717.1 hypothetical protein PSECIP111854_00816 [Pseudoalteromonas sp. CIP111854]CAH9057240.1 hypothetical protein PSECIP111951_01627 [Pseudoalteromonas sp. CIP111951]